MCCIGSQTLQISGHFSILKGAYMENYRKKYIEHLGLKELPSEYHVHHIDGDRTNNDISNLVALPAQTHGRYHAALHDFKLYADADKIKHVQTSIDPFARGHGIAHLIVYGIQRLDEAKLECMNWVMYRDNILDDHCVFKDNEVYGIKNNIKGENE